MQLVKIGEVFMGKLHMQSVAMTLAAGIVILACSPTELSVLSHEGLLSAAAFPMLAWLGLIVAIAVFCNFLFRGFLEVSALEGWIFGASVPLLLSPVFSVFWILLLADAGSATVVSDPLLFLMPTVGIVLLVASIAVRSRKHRFRESAA